MIRLVALSLAICLSAASSVLAEPPDTLRVYEISRMLPQQPRGVGWRIEDRTEWDRLAASPAFAHVVPDAERLLGESIPDVTEALYLEFTQSGNRTRCEGVLRQREKRLCTLVLAECLENQGRFLGAIEEMISLRCKERTWVYPAHDKQLDNYYGRVVEIDLFSSRTAWNLATAAYWLGERLPASTRELIRKEVSRRLLRPFEGAVARDNPHLTWLTRENNWNAVCLAGSVGTALAIAESVDRRAYFIAAAEQYRKHFLKSFPEDGYCTEGVGYWNYGFGHYIKLAEMTREATNGGIDWLAEPIARSAAQFPHRIRLTKNLYPAFADCGMFPKPRAMYVNFMDARTGDKQATVYAPNALRDVAQYARSSLPTIGLLRFANSAETDQPVVRPSPLRGWFPKHVALTCRPAPGTGGPPFTVAIKGGHNQEQHNHNDVGSYVAAVGDTPVLLDPGGEVYTARTFSRRRYDSRLINSFGHSVPVVAGKLQRQGRQAQALLVKKSFQDQQDSLTLDLASAYEAAGLKRLERTFTYSRVGSGSLVVVDAFEFESPQEFETALITIHPWRGLSPNELSIGGPGAGVRVTVSVRPADAAFEFKETKIQEDNGDNPDPVRIGVRLVKPLAKGSIAVKILPVLEN